MDIESGLNTPHRILRLPAVRVRTGRARSTTYPAITQGRPPKPISLGPQAVGWIEAEVDAGLRQQIEAGRPEPEARPVRASSAAILAAVHRHFLWAPPGKAKTMIQKKKNRCSAPRAGRSLALTRRSMVAVRPTRGGNPESGSARRSRTEAPWKRSPRRGLAGANRNGGAR